MTNSVTVFCNASQSSHNLQILARLTKTHVEITSEDQPRVSNGASDVATGMLASLEYVASLAPDSKLLGKDDVEYAQIHQWVDYALHTVQPGLNDLSAQKAFSKFINDAFLQKTYAASNHLTLADIALYSGLHGFVAQTTQKRRFELHNLVRWFDLVQHELAHLNYAALPLVEFVLDAPAEVELAKETPTTAAAAVKDKEMPEKKPNGAAPVASTDAPHVVKEKKEKKEKPVKEAKPEPEAEAPPTPARLDIRVGKIVAVKNHENADSLYVEQIDLGEAAPRTIVSGLVKHVPIDQMLNRMVVVLCNLKAAAMRGVKSEGMVLAATGADGKVELLTPSAGAVPGDKAYFEGFAEGTPDAVLNPKKKVWESIQPDLIVDAAKVATYKPASGQQCKLMTKSGPVTVDTVVGASIK